MSAATMAGAPLGVFGGTYDPIHFGHLRVAWESAAVLRGEVRMIPCRQPPHRAEPLASPEQRLAMLRSALEGQARLQVDGRELRRAGPSYMVDTLTELRAEIGVARPLVLLLGADAYAGLHSWRRWRELFELAHIGVLTRPGHDPELDVELRDLAASRQVEAADALRDSPAGRVLRIAVTPLEISASRIRDLVRSGQEPRYLTPDSVLRYIEQHALYRG